MVDVRKTYGDFENLIVQVALLDSGRATRATCVIGIPVRLQSGVGGSFQKQSEVLPPVAGYDAICARCLDLGNIWRKVGDFCSGCNSSPTIWMSGRLAASIALACERTDSPNE